MGGSGAVARMVTGGARSAVFWRIGLTPLRSPASNIVREVAEFMRNPPILISVLGFFAVAAGFVWIMVGLRAIGVELGDIVGDLPAYDNVGIWGILALVVGVAWIFAGLGLWALQSWAWMFAAIVAVFALVNAFFLMVAYAGSGAGLAQALMPALILWYLNTDEVKAAFGTGGQPQA